jgi:cytidylate kinase
VNYTQVALDGPAASGKSTIAERTAKALGYTFIDTGAMYRAATLKAMRLGIDLADEGAFGFLEETTFDFVDGRILMDDEDVSEAVRTTAVSNNVSLVSSHLLVRTHLVRIQQEMAKHRNIVMDGRDIGTKVLPDADVKIFLTASIEERARRRHHDNQNRGIASDLAALKEEIARRDRFDTTRKHSPLTPADDAIVLDTSHLTIDQVVARITEIIREVEKHGV